MSIRHASAVVLVREGPAGQELFRVRRSKEVALGGGFHAFPGGRVDDADGALAATLGLGDDGALRIAALRELFEETGVLLARGTFERAALDEERRALLANEREFGTALERLAALPSPELLHPAGRWLTPPHLRGRFDTRFYVAALPSQQTPSVWPGELADGTWIRPADALAAWRRADSLLHPPAVHILRSLASAPFPLSLAAMVDPPHVVDFVAQRIEFQAGIHVVPVRTPTLPPATHTNCWIVGDREFVVIDPASHDEDEQERLAGIITGLVAEGRFFREILLTHAHHDHVGGVADLRRRFAVPVRASVEAKAQLEGRVPVDGIVAADERMSFRGTPALRIRAVATPGHIRGHLCFFEETTGALVAGDMVAGIGSIVVDPPEGDMADYIASLQLLRALPVRALYPAHGPAIPDGPAKIDEYLAHRAAREQQVVDALVAGPATPIELVPRVYADVAPELHPLAARSLTAVLLKLEKESRARAEGEIWSLTQ